MDKLTSFTFNHADQETDVGATIGYAAVQSGWDSRGTELKEAINDTIDDLEAVTDGASGADQIGMTAISGITVSNNKIQDNLEAFDSYIASEVQDVIDTQISDGGITTAKLGVLTADAFGASAVTTSKLGISVSIEDFADDNGIDNDSLATDVKVGSLSSLTTPTTTSLVGAINDLNTMCA